MPSLLCGILFLISIAGIIYYYSSIWMDNAALKEQQARLETEREEAQRETEFEWPGKLIAGAGAYYGKIDFANAEPMKEPEILAEYQSLYEQNPDMVGWLKIEDTLITYPVMQTPEDENYYLYLDFYKQDNLNGSLILDTDSNLGNKTKPSTNLIIHGHTMKSGQMFGNLKLYKDEAYGMSHNIIEFDSLYEKRKYELISVFYSQVFYANQDIFKYYKFFQADTQEEFDDWYENIKEMSLYDTGVTAEFGDEFITLSCCAYHVEDGRFVVVGKRIA